MKSFIFVCLRFLISALFPGLLSLFLSLSFPPYHLTFYVGVLHHHSYKLFTVLLWLTVFYYLAQILPDIFIIRSGSTEFLTLCDMSPSFMQRIFLHQHFISNHL